MTIDITKIANVILYMIENEVTQINDKKVSILLFLIDYYHLENCKEKIFNETYVKEKRNPEPKVLSEIFDIMANNEDLEEDDNRLYIIRELLDFLDIEIITKEKYIELKFIKMEEEFNQSLFDKKELKTIQKIIEKYKDFTPRNLANECFKIDKVRQTKHEEVII